MCVGLLVEVVRLISGRTIGLEVFLYGFASPAFLICPMIRGWQWRLWWVEGGVLVAVLGCGRGAFLGGRRSVSGSVMLCCMILFCRIILLTGGDGYSIPFLAIQWKGLIIFLHRFRSLLLGVYLMMYGINMFLLKFLCLFGDFFATGFPRRIILWGIVSFITMLISVLEVWMANWVGPIGLARLTRHFWCGGLRFWINHK